MRGDGGVGVGVAVAARPERKIEAESEIETTEHAGVYDFVHALEEREVVVGERVGRQRQPQNRCQHYRGEYEGFDVCHFCW